MMKKFISVILIICLGINVLFTCVSATDEYIDAYTTMSLHTQYYQYDRAALNTDSIGFSGGNSWINYKVDFGDEGARVIRFKHGVPDSYAGSVFSIYLDNLSSTPILTYTVEGTGAWTPSQEHEFVLDTPVTGQHIVYLHGSKSGTGNFKDLVFGNKYQNITSPVFTLYDSGNNAVTNFAEASKITVDASVLNYASTGINANLVLVPYSSSFKRISAITVDAETNINNGTTPAVPTLSMELADVDGNSVFFSALLDDDFKTLTDSAFYNAPSVSAPTRSTDKVIDYYIDGTSITLFGKLADASTKALLGIRQSDKAKNAYSDYQFIYETAVADSKYEHTFAMDDDTPTGSYTAILSSNSGSTDEVSFHYSRPLDIVDAFSQINASTLPTTDDTVLTEIDNELNEWQSTLGISEKLAYIDSKPEKNWMYTQIHGYLPFADLNELNSAIDKTIFLHKINTTDDDVNVMEEYKTVTGITGVDYYVAHYATVDKENLNEKLAVVMSDKLPLTDVGQFNSLFREAITLSKMSNLVSWGSVDEAIGDFELILNSSYTEKYKALSNEWRKVAATEFLYKDFSSVADIADLLETAYELALSEKQASEQAKKKPSGNKGGGGGGGSFKIEVPKIDIPAPEEVTPVIPAEPVKTISFNDLEGYEWAKDAVMYLAQKGTINGKSENMFHPEDNISRAEFVKILVLALGGVDDTAKCSFADVSTDAWYSPYVSTAYSRGWVNGYKDGTFGVSDNVTREQMAAMLYRAIVDTDGATDVINSTVSFVDYEQISSYATEAIMSLAKSELMNGVGMGEFQPKRNATRAETAVLVYKYLINR